MRKTLTSLACIAAFMCLGAQSTCLNVADRVCDEQSFLDRLEDAIRAELDDE